MAFTLKREDNLLSNCVTPKYMKTLPNDEIKTKVEQDYPDDYITQKGVYDMALKAKQDMQ